MTESELANQIYCSFWKGEPKIPTEQAVLLAATKNIDSDAPIDAAWRSVAREVLRLMEWVYECRKQDERLGEGIETALTLPPDDWKPNAFLRS